MPNAELPEPVPDRAHWQDRLVELHVLADHGDPEAATIAESWLATDEQARRRWDTVQRACDRVRSVDDPGRAG